MLDRRGFLAAMLGTALAPKDVLSGLATPAPIKKAVSDWVCVWREVAPLQNIGGVMMAAYEVEISVPEEIAHLFKGLRLDNKRTGGSLIATPTS